MIFDVLPSIPSDVLLDQLRRLGVVSGGVLVVHTAFSKVRPVDHGIEGLIAALEAAVGPAGTVVMPSMADVDDEPFRPEMTTCMAMGMVAETFWRLPGVLRSDSPHAFAARGPYAAWITRPHPIEIPHGIESPVGRAYQLDSQVLLLGVGHDANTTIHLAENLAGVGYRHQAYSTVMVNGELARVDYSEVDHCCQKFSLMDGWLEGQGAQRRDIVGHGTARLARSRAIVDAAMAHLAECETIFLHPPGVCDQCDEARRSMTC